MKKKRKIILLLLLIIGVAITSCVNDKDFSVPTDLGLQENETLNTILDSIANNQLELKTIQQVKEFYVSGNEPLKIVSNIVVKGYVISSDQTGNYFREFYMQDAPENPITGIKIALNLSNSYNKFNFGREVYIRLKGLYIGETNSGDGVVTIGGKIKSEDPRDIEAITVNQLSNHIYRSQNTEIITPKLIAPANVNNSNVGIFVKLKNVFFDADLKGKSYVDPTEDFDTKRKLQACNGIGTVDLLLETSSFANFANNTLPDGGGEINAVISKDFGGDFFVLVLNKMNDVNMTEERCAPLSIIDFPTVLLSEDFEKTSGNINITGWTNFIEAGTKSWRSYLDSNSNSKATRIGSFLSRNTSTIGWLITKEINLENTTQEFLSFETSNSFADGSELEVLISTNWDGNEATITTATWENLPAKIIDDGANHEDFVHSTYIDISTYSGTAYIAFKYVGSGNEDFDGTFELDNIIINAK